MLSPSSCSVRSRLKIISYNSKRWINLRGVYLESCPIRSYAWDVLSVQICQIHFLILTQLVLLGRVARKVHPYRATLRHRHYGGATNPIICNARRRLSHPSRSSDVPRIGATNSVCRSFFLIYILKIYCGYDLQWTTFHPNMANLPVIPGSD